MNRQERRHSVNKSTSYTWVWWLAGAILVVIIAFVLMHSHGTGVDYSQYSYTDDVYARPNATHVIEEFSDFQCPYCQALSPTIRAIRDSNPDVRIVYKQFPLTAVHEHAELAAEASECARDQNRFWAYHDVLFESQEIDANSLKLHAEGLGLNMTEWNTCMNSGLSKAKIAADTLEGQQRGVQGTPSLFIDGKAFNGRTLADFNAALQ